MVRFWLARPTRSLSRLANIEGADQRPVEVSHSWTDSTRPRSDENTTENTATEYPSIDTISILAASCARRGATSAITSVTRRSCHRRDNGRSPSHGAKSVPHIADFRPTQRSNNATRRSNCDWPFASVLTRISLPECSGYRVAYARATIPTNDAP